jgi:hypothetical protein
LSRKAKKGNEKNNGKIEKAKKKDKRAETDEDKIERELKNLAKLPKLRVNLKKLEDDKTLYTISKPTKAEKKLKNGSKKAAEFNLSSSSDEEDNNLSFVSSPTFFKASLCSVVYRVSVSEFFSILLSAIFFPARFHIKTSLQDEDEKKENGDSNLPEFNQEIAVDENELAKQALLARAKNLNSDG